MDDIADRSEDDRAVEELRKILLPVEPLPLGLRSRWEARIQQEARETRQGSLALTTLALAAFLGGCAVAGPEAFGGWMWTALVGGAAAYSIGVRRLIG